jgi:glycine cleavage system H lipoate-binding protein
MKKKVTSEKNGAENIRLSRLATRQSNLEEDRKTWEILKETPCSKSLPVYKLNKRGRQIKDSEFNQAMNVGHTISERIVSKMADWYNVTRIDQVTTDMIKDMALEYLSWPEKAQLLVCRDPSRQSIDEEVQLATLEKYLTNATVVKPTNGVLTLVNGELVKKPKNEKVEARSIDITVNKNNKDFYIFAKYSASAGSGQQHQVEESMRFAKEAMKYVDKNNDGKYFIILTDGDEGERHLPEINEQVKKYPNIYAGNCENVIDFIEAIK